MGESRRRRDFERQRPENRLGDAPVEAEYHAKMTAIMQGLDEVMNGDAKGADRKVGIVLMVYPMGEAEGGRCNYMSNSSREDVVVLMKEMIQRFSGQPEVSGKA